MCLGALQLPTGKLLKPEHENSGVAAVTAITLNKLSRAVKLLSVDDREWALLKEIILFDPGQCLLHMRAVCLTLIPGCLSDANSRMFV